MEFSVTSAFLTCMNVNDSEVPPLRQANIRLLYIICGTLMAVAFLILLLEVISFRFNTFVGNRHIFINSTI